VSGSYPSHMGEGARAIPGRRNSCAACCEVSAWRGLRSWRTGAPRRARHDRCSPFSVARPRSRARLPAPCGNEGRDDLVPRARSTTWRSGRPATSGRLSLKTGASSAGVLGRRCAASGRRGSSPQSGCSAGSGSVEKTSRTAPPMRRVVQRRDQRASSTPRRGRC